MPKKKPQEGNPEVHKDLQGLDFSIDSFGRLKSKISLNKINKFLDDNVDDLKLIEKKEKEQGKPEND